jgi:hypothetical protein
MGGFDFHRSLVSFNFHQRLTGAHGITMGLEPTYDDTCFLRHSKHGHDDRLRHHNAPLTQALARAATDSGVGTVRSSKAGEKGTGTSIAPMRWTGASRW